MRMLVPAAQDEKVTVEKLWAVYVKQVWVSKMIKQRLSSDEEQAWQVPRKMSAHDFYQV